MWHGTFEPYITRISSDFSIQREGLLESFKRLHQKYKTTEASFIYKELEILSEDQKLIFVKVLTCRLGEKKGRCKSLRKGWRCSFLPVLVSKFTTISIAKDIYKTQKLIKN